LSIQSGDLRSNIERISNLDSVRRIERDQSAQDFGQKERDANRNRGNPHHAPISDEEPHDVVDVSSAYHASDTENDTGETAPTVKPSSVPVPPTPAPDHHLDIKV
jgi:hypothetical protein